VAEDPAQPIRDPFPLAAGRGLWQVTGIRKDAYAQCPPIPVESRKPKAERGRYLQPELFGKPRRMWIVTR
jgi:hypothetical protein